MHFHNIVASQTFSISFVTLLLLSYAFWDTSNILSEFAGFTSLHN